MSTDTWRFADLSSDASWEGPLEAYWQVHLDSISDEYSPHEISAENLLRRWLDRLNGEYPAGLVPIYWFVRSHAAATFHRMPFAYDHSHGKQTVEDFLQLFTWPQNVVTGLPVNWLTLPVVDKQWNERQADQGGFIQEVTRWKPGILQTCVYLPSLVWATGKLS